jgi:hypothetical protein
MFVGDSLSRNQWQSLTCMLHFAVPDAEYDLTRQGDVSTFTFTVCHNPLLIYFYFFNEWNSHILSLGAHIFGATLTIMVILTQNTYFFYFSYYFFNQILTDYLFHSLFFFKYYFLMYFFIVKVERNEKK